MTHPMKTRTVWPDWEHSIEIPLTQCKHGAGSCEKCGTSDRRDVVHTARTPNKRQLRRQRRKKR